MTKKRVRIPLLTVKCDDFVIEAETEDEEDLYPREGEQVVFKRKLPARLIKLVLQWQSLQALEDEDAEDPQVNAELKEVMEELVPMMAEVTVRWDWADIWDDDTEIGEDLPMLPQPESAGILWSLDTSELFFLISKLFELLKAPKAKDSP